MYNNPQGYDPSGQETYQYPQGQPFQSSPQQNNPETYQYYQQQMPAQPTTPPVPGQFVGPNAMGFSQRASRPNSGSGANPLQWFKHQNRDLQIGIISGIVILLCIIVFGVVALNASASGAPTTTGIPNSDSIPTATPTPVGTATPTPIPTPTP